MNKKETAQIMAILKAAYPAYYKNMAEAEILTAVNLWASMFDEDYSLVSAAVKLLIATDEKGFPPHVGAVKAKIRQITEPQGMTELEAWALVRKAIAGASMDKSSRLYQNGVQGEQTSAERNFAELPEQLQRLIGSPSQLAAWELLDNSDIETVVQSNFMRSYRARVSADREYNALPADVKQMIEGATKCLTD